METEQFWEKIRLIVREEIARQNQEVLNSKFELQTPGLTYKPLYKMSEVCAFFEVTRPTIYDWIRHGKLKPYKIRSRVYFLHNENHDLLKAG